MTYGNMGYGFPVLATPGGGLVRKTDEGTFIFVRAPFFYHVPTPAGLGVGDELPESWGPPTPDNELAHQESMRDDLNYSLAVLRATLERLQ